MNINQIVTSDLIKLRAKFVAKGFDIRLVGGCVRDMIRNIEPKDIDLCTDANPDEQIAIYKANGVRYFETGLQHGTISVKLGDEVYEITSLRTETDHDGRHATVSYTKDWLRDLSRRDLTVNAMAMTFDGELIDPYNGVDDLKHNRVRFVGNADERMQEDYLRILRWIRFQGRIGNGSALDIDTVKAAMRNVGGLDGISRERVWMEVSKIISGPNGPWLMQDIQDIGIGAHIDLPKGDAGAAANVARFTKIRLR